MKRKESVNIIKYFLMKKKEERMKKNIKDDNWYPYVSVYIHI